MGGLNQKNRAGENSASLFLCVRCLAFKLRTPSVESVFHRLPLQLQDPAQIDQGPEGSNGVLVGRLGALVDRVAAQVFAGPGQQHEDPDFNGATEPCLEDLVNSWS